MNQDHKTWSKRRLGRPGMVALVLGSLLLAGCEEQPRAPALVQGEAVYYNRGEKFRLEPPPG